MKKLLQLLLAVLTLLMGIAEADEVFTKDDIILVVGATGRTGKLIIAELTARGYQVRGMVRDQEKARALLGENVALVVGDLTDPASLVAASKGVAGIINAAGANIKGNPEQIDFGGTKNLVQAAQQNGVRKIVLLSSLGVTDKDHFLNKVANNVLIWKFEGEQVLRQSGLQYAIVRPGGLSDRKGGEAGIEFGQGDKISGSIPRADVARVCVEAFLLADANGKTMEIIGAAGAAPADFAPLFSALSKDSAAAQE